MEFLLVQLGITASIILVCVSCVFLLAVYARDNSIMDIFYGPIYFITATATLLLTGTSQVLTLAITLCIGLWALRLGSRIYLKNRGKPEDARYAAWRTQWTARGRWYFLLRSYLQINLLQGLIICIVLLPFTVASAQFGTISIPFLALGLLVFSLGLAYETTADWQLDRYIAGKKRGEIIAPLMTTGLFAYSRRPNYFGESLIWWGLALIVLPLPYGWIALLSPLMITLILTRVTGPMLEKIFLEKYPEEYGEYMRTTNYLIPGRKKSN